MTSDPHFPLLRAIDIPHDLPESKLPQVAEELRKFLIESIGKTGGQLASDLANRVGTDYTRGRREEVASATGVISANYITLQEVTVGNIKQHDVYAAALIGQLPARPPLGVSVLKRVAIEKNKQMLELRKWHPTGHGASTRARSMILPHNLA